MGKEFLEERRMIMKWRERVRICFMTALVTSVVLFLPLFAFAGGTGHEPNGVEDYLIGVTPPPSVAAKVYLQWYTANKLKDNRGNTLSLARDGVALDKLNVYVESLRFFWITPFKFSVGGFDGFFNAHTVFPFVKPNLHLDVLTPGGPIDVDSSHSGLGDWTIGPGVAWHHKSGLLHGITAVDFVAPTGLYDRRNPNVSPGQNDWTIAPVLIFTYFLPFYPNVDISMKFCYSFNTKNNDWLENGTKTYRKPGQELQIDYSVGHAIWGGKPGLTLRGGVAGYMYFQTTDDKTGFGTVEDEKGRVFAIGPTLMFDYKNWIFSGHVYWEMGARNRPEGVQSQLTILFKF
jgi:hypothetical protein